MSDVNMSESMLRYLPMVTLPVVVFLAVALGLQVRGMQTELSLLSDEVATLQGRVARMQAAAVAGGGGASLGTPPARRGKAKAGKAKGGKAKGGKAKGGKARGGKAKAGKSKGGKAKGGKARRDPTDPPVP